MQKSKKCIVIAVTASIAAYKICDLVRVLTKQSYSTQILMTENALRFVSKLSLETLSKKAVLVSEWDDGMLHIDIKNIASIFAVIPATANCIGKFANGIADDIVSSSYLAAQCPLVIAPAMNPGMYQSKAVQRNLKTLKEDGVHIISPKHGEVICGDTGQGKMAPIEEIAEVLIKLAK